VPCDDYSFDFSSIAISFLLGHGEDSPRCHRHPLSRR
jgi:hypothetical protein